MGGSIAGIIDETGRRVTGDDIINCIAMMALRANGLGGGFAGYGIYPDHADDFCFHVMYTSEEAQAQVIELVEVAVLDLHDTRFARAALDLPLAGEMAGRPEGGGVERKPSQVGTP